MNQHLALLFFLTASGGFADTIQFTALPVNTQYGTYNGYASATINGTPLEALICDDFNHETFVPSGPMDFSLSTLTGSNPLQNARFVDPNQQTTTINKYEEAAVLLDGLNHTGPGLLLDLTGDYQYALWMLFTPTVNAPNATAQTLLNDAAAAVRANAISTQALYSELRIFTPTAAFASNQEFLQLSASATSFDLSDPGGPVATPEAPPSVLFAIGIGAISLSLLVRRFLKREAAEVRAIRMPHGFGR
ncbi:MAG TPA: hypothetical protein VKU19_35130 [Bryobacteraceae bacterium]|nr:hypothetical protein [Bryobacteraceae bacterium]